MGFVAKKQSVIFRSCAAAAFSKAWLPARVAKPAMSIVSLTITDSLDRREVLHTQGEAGLKRVVKKEHADGQIRPLIWQRRREG